MSKVAQSALVFGEAYPGVDPINPDLIHSQYTAAGLLVLRLLAPVAPKLGGLRPREAYYLERIRRAYQSGLAAGRPASK
jgi:hypothetical protein